MNDMLREEDFGEILPLIRDKHVTDIDYNGYSLWVTDLKKGRYPSSITLTERFVKEFTEHVADCVNRPFNKMNCTLEAQTDDLRITVTHEGANMTGRAFSIRKSLREMRNDEKTLVASGFCSQEVMDFLKQLIRARHIVVFCGEPGVGKTESVKFFSGFTPENERIITIEDTPELHLHEVYGERDIEELLISNELTYTEAIKHCLRKNPNWVILSEARSTEVKYLIEQWSTGLKGFTTLHLDDLRGLPDRLLNMMERAEDSQRLKNNIYSYVNAGVLIRRKEVENPDTKQREIVRYIDQIALYDRDQNENHVYLLMDQQKLQDIKLPEKFVKRMGLETAKLGRRALHEKL